MKLDTGIEIPGSRNKYDFESWKVGESHFCERLEEIESIQNSAYAWAKRRKNGYQFTRRMVEGGYRLWRVA